MTFSSASSRLANCHPLRYIKRGSEEERTGAGSRLSGTRQTVGGTKKKCPPMHLKRALFSLLREWAWLNMRPRSETGFSNKKKRMRVFSTSKVITLKIFFPHQGRGFYFVRIFIKKMTSKNQSKIATQGAVVEEVRTVFEEKNDVAIYPWYF